MTDRESCSDSWRDNRAAMGAYARALCRSQGRINRLFATNYFRNPALGIILDLYASETEGVEVSVSSLESVSGVSLSTTLRYVSLLEDDQLIVRVPDDNDGRRVLARLTDRGRYAVDALIVTLAVIERP